MSKTSTITNINILWRNEKNKAILNVELFNCTVLAVVNVELFNCIVLKYSVIEGNNGIFAVPSTSLHFFINNEKLYKEIAEKVVDVYKGNTFKEK